MLKKFTFANLGIFKESVLVRTQVEKEGRAGFTETGKDRKGGLALLVGENNAGKSSCFEFIRRCLSEEISKSDSNVFDPTKVAYAVCEFAVDMDKLNFSDDLESAKTLAEELKDIYPMTIDKGLIFVEHARKTENHNFDELIDGEAEDMEKTIGTSQQRQTSSKHQKPDTELPDSQQEQKQEKERTFAHHIRDIFTGKVEIYAAIIYHKKRRMKIKFLLIRNGKCNYLLVERKQVEVVEYFVMKIEKMFAKLKSVFDDGDKDKEKNEKINKIFNFLDSIQVKYNDERTKDTVKDVVTCTYAGLFGKKGRVRLVFDHRGIGPLDSSMSSKMNRGRMNYEDTVARAELFSYFLWEIEKDAEKKDAYEKIAEELLGENFKSVKFKRIDEHNVNIIYGDNERTTDLLKVPEGIYETHLFAMLLSAAPEYSTLLLDEPNRCVHLSVLENMCNIIVEWTRKMNISFVISTHSPGFIVPDTWKHVHLFKRSENSSRVVSCQNTDKTLIQKYSRNIPLVKGLFFARKCIFVEGPSDEKVIREFMFILAKKEGTDPSLTSGLLSTPVIPMSGAGTHKRLAEFCDYIQVPCFTILDGDKKKKYTEEETNKFKIFFWSENEIEGMIEHHYSTMKMSPKKLEKEREKLKNMDDCEIREKIEDMLLKEEDGSSENVDLTNLKKELESFYSNY